MHAPAREPHEHEVAKPRGERDVPAVPEVHDVGGGKGRAEVARAADAQAVARAHGHEAVALEVAEEVEAVLVGAPHLEPKLRRSVDAAAGAAPRGRRVAAVDPRRQHELVRRAGEEEQDAAGKEPRVLVAGGHGMGVGGKATAPVDGAGRELRKEQQEVEPVLEPEVPGADEPVTDLDRHLDGLERYVADAHEAPEAGTRGRGELVDRKRDQARHHGQAVARIAPRARG